MLRRAVAQRTILATVLAVAVLGSTLLGTFALLLTSSEQRALEVTLSSPGSSKPGTNPEQLFGVGYSACFTGAMQLVAAAMKIKLPVDTAVDASVSLGRTENDSAYGLAVNLAVSLPGLDRAQAQEVVDGAHQACPYSHATRGNIEVAITLV